MDSSLDGGGPIISYYRLLIKLCSWLLDTRQQRFPRPRKDSLSGLGAAFIPLEKALFSQVKAKMSNANWPTADLQENIEEEEESAFELECVQLARAHWIQMHR